MVGRILVSVWWWLVVCAVLFKNPVGPKIIINREENVITGEYINIYSPDPRTPGHVNMDVSME